MPRRRAPRAVVAACLAALVGTSCADVVVLEPGDPIEFVQQPQTSKILAADGSVLATLHAEQDREDVALDRVPDELIAAVVAVEDRRFFLHRGIDVPAIARAAVRNYSAGEIEEGGSTITQQYVKNTMLGPSRTLERKLEEAALAYQLEQRYDKDEILERYLNTIYFGHGAYGVAAAAERYYDRDVGQLTLDQSALLAALIAAPSSLDPYEHPDAALARRDRVLRAMVETGAIDPARRREASRAPLDLAPLERAPRVLAPYAVEEVKRLIARNDRDAFSVLGADEEDRVNALFTGGLRVWTTIDLKAQEHAERAVAQVLSDPGDPSAALVALDPRTGAVEALVGGRDFYDPDDPHARFDLATQGRRQVGSAFKPIVLARALEVGTSLDRVFPGGKSAAIDDPRCAGEEGPWRPTNYAGHDYGQLTLREATVHSVNTVYARLSPELGPETIVAKAHDLGIRGDLEPLCAIALGAEEASPWDLAGAYAAFAALGRRHPQYLIGRIETAGGEVLYEHEDDSYQAVDEAVAYLVSQTLQEVVRRGTGVLAGIGRPQAGKTGTTDDTADAWFAGYTPDLVAVVWVGFPAGRIAMEPPRTRTRVEGGTWPAEIWAAFAGAHLAGRPAEAFPVPAVDLVTVEVDITRNCLPNPYTPPDLIQPREYLAGTQPTEQCTEPTGPPIDDVPAVAGLRIDVATRLLESKGFLVEQRPINSGLYPPGYVTGQQPEPGGTITEGSAVIVWVSTADRTRLVVPDVTGFEMREAQRRLEAEGWVVVIHSECPAAGCPDHAVADTVFAQEPVGGEQALRYSVVTLRAYPGQDGAASPAPADDGRSG